MDKISKQNKNSFAVEKAIICFYIFAHFIGLIYMIQSKKLAGDFYGMNVPVTLSTLELILAFALTITIYFLFYMLYKLSAIRKIAIKYKFSLNKNLFDRFYFILLLAQTVFVLTTGVGRVFSGANSRFSFIFSILNIDCIFGIYFFLCRRRKFIYILNISLFLFNNFIRGWFGVVLTLFFYETYCQIQKGTLKRYSNKLWWSVPPILFMGGGLIYKLVYPIKMYIRLHERVSLSYLDAVIKLMNRISFFPVSILAFQNVNQISKLYNWQNINFLEIKTMLRPILPRFLMPFKEFRVFSNLIEMTLYPDIPNTVSTEMGVVSYFYVLIKTNLCELIFWIFFICAVSLFVKIIFQMFCEYDGQLDFLWFLFLIDLIKVGSLSTLSYYYLYFFYLIPIMFAIGVIKIKRIK